MHANMAVHTRVHTHHHAFTRRETQCHSLTVVSTFVYLFFSSSIILLIFSLVLQLCIPSSLTLLSSGASQSDGGRKGRRMEKICGLLFLSCFFVPHFLLFPFSLPFFPPFLSFHLAFAITKHFALHLFDIKVCKATYMRTVHAHTNTQHTCDMHINAGLGIGWSSIVSELFEICESMYIERWRWKQEKERSEERALKNKNKSQVSASLPFLLHPLSSSLHFTLAVHALFLLQGH